jgi:hypothetical protein
MGWADWLVPTISDEQQFEMEKYRRILTAMASSDPNRLAQIASDMMKHNIMLQSILTKATGHITALEADQALVEWKA